MTEGQGNGAIGGITYGGSDIEQPLHLTRLLPTLIYLTDTAGSDARLTINVHDPIYVPSWGEADATAASPGAKDAREFVYWQDWYGGDTADQTMVLPLTQTMV